MAETPEPPPKKRSAYERWVHAQKWFWSAWTDEAVMIYRRTAHGKDRARVRLIEFLLFFREIIREFYRVEGTSRAASLAYTTLLSLIPLLVALSKFVSGYFHQNLRDQMPNILNLLVPYQSSQIAAHINRFMEGAEAASAIGALLFLFIAFRLFMAVEATINQIWRVQTMRGWRQKIRAFTMLLAWGPLLIGLSFVTSTTLQKNPYLKPFMQYPIFFDWLIPLIVLFVGFTMLFWLVPATRVQFKSAAVAAAITAVLFQAVRFGFGAYTKYLFEGRMNVVYGTLTLLVIFLIALELMWVVVLLGVEISYVYQNLQGILRASEQQLESRPEYDVYFAIRALIEIGRRFERREDAPSSYRLAQEFGSTDEQMLAVLRKLEDAKLVKEIGGDWTGFVPGCDPDRITVLEVIEVMEGGRREIPHFDNESVVQQKMKDLFQNLRTCTAESLGRLTIGQMVRELYGPRVPSRIADAAPRASEA
jgi:YihY family inner membrane protein